MYIKRISLLFFIASFQFVSSQVKIGEQPDNIDAASIVELESTNKALVLTRLTTSQMQSITPLRGALVYNTDTQCIHYFNGLLWNNLCQTNTGSNQMLSFDDVTNIISLENGGSVDLTKFLSSSLTQADIEAMGFAVGPHITDTNTQLSETEVDAYVANNGYLTTEVDGDATNELNTGISFDGTYLIVTDGGGNQSVDISALAYDDTAIQNSLTANATAITDEVTRATNAEVANTALINTNTANITSNDTDIANNTTAITTEVTRATAAETAVQTNLDTHITADKDIDETNELSDLNLDATSNILTLTNAEAGATGVDLSGFVSTDDQNLESATLSATSELAVNIEGGNDVTVDLSDLEESADITANTALINTNTTNITSNDTDIANNNTAITTEVARATAAETAVQTNLDTHITTDKDIDETNELSDLNLDATSNILTLTNAEAGATGVDLSGFVSTDDQNLESATLSATSQLAVNIEGGNDVTVSLSDLEESADITANTALINTNTTNITSNDTDIANNTTAITTEVTRATAAEAAVQTNLDTHITADKDIDETNELSDLNLDATSNILTLTNAEAGATGVDLSGFVSTDDQNLESATLSATSELAVNIEGGNDVTVDLSDLEESADITANTALINTNTTNITSNDTDIANNTTAITTEVTRAAAAETAIQNDVDQNEADADTAIALVQTNLDTHITADKDIDETNELSDLNLDATSNILTLTNAEAGATGVDLSGFVSTDDQNLESATLSATSELAVNIEGGNDVTVDLSDLEESSDIVANTALITTNTTNITSNDTDIANNTTAISTEVTRATAAETAIQNNVDQNETDADTAIALVQTNLDTHITADKDIDETNELSDLNLDATSNILTLTNAEAGATGVDLSGFVSTDDQNLESATLSTTSELAVNIEGGNDVTVDLSDLEESSDIAANTALITTNTTNITSNDTDIANNNTAITTEVTRATAAETAIQNDVNQNEADADTAIALVQTNLDTHITTDKDIDETNELSDLNLDATSNILTLTNAEAGATGVDLSGFVSTDDQNLESATLSATSQLAVNIEGGNDVTVSLSDLEESADITANTALINTNTANITSNDTDIANNTTAITTEVTRATAAETAVQTNLDTHITADKDIDETNELSDLNLDATSNILTLTNAEAGATGVDLSGFVSTDDQNLESATLSATSELAVNIEGGNDVTVDLSDLEESADITANTALINTNTTNITSNDTDIANNTTAITNEVTRATAAEVANTALINTNTANITSNDTDIANNTTAIATEVARATAAETAVQTNLDTHITADKDIDETNELSDLNLDATSNILTLTNAEAGATGVDLSGFVSTDDQNLESATLSATSELAVNIEGGNDVTVDLSDLEESSDIAANTALITTNTTNITSNDTDIANNTTAITTEVTRATAAETAIQNDVDQNETDADTAIALVQTNLDTHITADKDIDETNELSDLSLDATSNILTLTNAEAGATGVDLSGFVSTDDQNLESATLSATSELAVNIEGGNDVTVDLSDLEESADITANTALISTNTTNITSNDTDIANNTTAITNEVTRATAAEAAIQNDVDQNELDSDNAIALVQTNLDDHELADKDIDETNELSDLNLDATSNILTLTNAEAGATGVDLSGYVSTDDQNLESATLSATSELAINIEGGNDVTVDLSNLEESADITANTALINTNTTNITSNDTDITNNTTAIATEVARATAAETAVQTNLDTHITADKDIDETNELSDLNLDATSNILTLTNAEAGATGVDLSGFVSTDDQNLESATLSATSELAVNIEGGNDVTVDLSDLEESADITANTALINTNTANITSNDTDIANNNTAITNEVTRATAAEAANTALINTNTTNITSNDTDIANNTTAITNEVTRATAAEAAVQTNLDTHITADKDIDETNELSDLNLDATSNVLTLTNAEAGATGVDLSGYVSSDDQNLESATLSATSQLAVNIEGGNDVTVSLSDLEESADITANTALISTNTTNITSNDTDIANNTTAISTEVARATAAEAAIQNDVDQNELDADNAIALVQTNLDDHELADKDIDETNELSDLNLDATSNILTLTNAEAGATGVDLSGFVSSDDQEIDFFAFNDSTFELEIGIESVVPRKIVNLSSLHADGTETKIVAGNTGITITGDGSASLPYGIYNNFTEVDGSILNEINTGFSTVNVSGTDYLRITDSNGNLDVPLSDLEHTGTTGSVFFADTDGTATENNTQLFWDNTNNRLGIGTTSPSNKFHVTGAIRSEGFRNSDGTGNTPAYRFHDDTDTGLYRPAADEIGFSVGGIEALKIDETSNKTTVIINETLELDGPLLDENDSKGTDGQVLTATATGTEWVTNYNPVKAIGKISGTGSVIKATTGVTTSRISRGRYQVTLPTGSVSDNDYIIQLTQPGRGGAGNDDPGISYSNQTTTGFQVIIGDNDNGGTDRNRFDSEFMFTILDL